MGQLTYTAIASLDGYIEDEQGTFEFAFPPPEVHAFANELDRPVGVHLYGRRMYETMVFWETGGDDDPITREYAEQWRGADKVVFSRTLATATSQRTTIEREFTPEVVHRFKESSSADLAIGGSELAGQALAAGVVDEVRLLLAPVIIGGGTRALPDGVRATLRLEETRSFEGGFVYLRYGVTQ